MGRRPDLTSPKADEIYAYVVEYKRIHDGLSPTYRNIAKVVGLSSTSMVSFYLHKLFDSGRLRPDEAGLVVPNGHWEQQP